jgi:hypothetical protein
MAVIELPKRLIPVYQIFPSLVNPYRSLQLLETADFAMPLNMPSTPVL